jgi:hypothetical protein
MQKIINYRKIKLGLLIGMMMLSGCIDTSVIPSQKTYAMVKKPTTPLELLKNARFAIDHDLLVRLDFYTQENLERFFGGHAHIQTAESQENYLIRGNIDNLEDVFSETKKYWGLKITFKLYYENQRKLHANFGIPGASADPHMTVDIVKNIFDVRTKMSISKSDYLSLDKKIPEILKNSPFDPSRSAPFTGYYSPATHELGNKKIEFIFPETTTITKVNFITLGAGQVSNFSINQSEK